MKYMVLECHLSYAVVLDEAGRFLKVANRSYEVGQTVTDVIEMQIPQPAPQAKRSRKWVYSLAAAAACLVLIFASLFQRNQAAYASVYMAINPEVRIDVNRRDQVVGLEGINADGQTLIGGYAYSRKELNQVMDELVNRAVEMGYLLEGGQITLELDADSGEWIVSHSGALADHLNEYLDETLRVTVQVSDRRQQSQQVIIPVPPGDGSYSDSDYGEIQPTAAPTAPPQPSVPAGDSGYDDGQTDYGDWTESGQSAYGTVGDGQSDYGDAVDSQLDYDDGQSNYDDSGYEESD